jgi:hypothetical protein
MKLLNMAILATALCFPLVGFGCGGVSSGGNEAPPADVGEVPAETDMDPALTAPPLEAPE